MPRSVASAFRQTSDVRLKPDATDLTPDWRSRSITRTTKVTKNTKDGFFFFVSFVIVVVIVCVS